MKRIIIMLMLMSLTVGCGLLNKDKEAIQQIENNLNLILGSELINQTSSNPYDYITIHSEEFNNIVSSDEIALNYFLSVFEEGSENGLKEYIMAAVCVEILGNENFVKDWSSGRDWYQQYTGSGT
ncbi:hypothetical protein LG311_11435 [Sutcliffiella horikoshii]|uniref:hypothetical protein n=1 Tax=Sutcliffiella horikoshii TaxID=79883 RepID=UPI00384B719D